MEIAKLEDIRVELINNYLTEKQICEITRVSFDGHKSIRETKEDEKLIKYLMVHKHLSPFEHGKMTFLITAPLFVFGQLKRYRTCNFSELSLRYREAKHFCYIPVQEPYIIQVLEDCYKEYEKLLIEGIAKEASRSILPNGTMSKLFVTVDLRNLMHIIQERIAPNAQKEIRVVAEQMLELFRSKYPNICERFEEGMSS